jgi:hypothetical protein
VFAAQFAGYWRDGKRVVMDRNAVLPDRCFKCNEPANGYRRAENLTYVPTSRQLMFGVWSYLDAKRASVEIGLCDRHRRSRARTVAFISLAAIALAILEVTQLQPRDVIVPIIAAAAFIGGCVGFVYAAFPRHMVRPADLTETHIWLKGAGEEFLASLPTAPMSFDQGLPTLPGTIAASTDPAVAAAKVFRDARNGAILFFAGAVITAITYYFSPSGYLIAGGLVIVGLIRLIAASRAYLRLPAERRNRQQILTLAGLIGAGLIAGGWVVTSEATMQTQMNQFEAALNASTKYQNQAAALFADIGNRQIFTAQESLDMRKVSSLYGHAADTLAASPAPTAYVWYRDGLVRNCREAADIATGYSYLSSSSSQSAFDALYTRWLARVGDLKQLQARLKAQQSRSP